MTDYTDLEIHLFPREAAGYPVTLRLGAEQEFPPGYLAAELLPWVSTGAPVAAGKRLWAALLADPVLRDAWDPGMAVRPSRLAG